ncbi:MAG: hypothetical protein NVS9B2_28800 [Steroidobacteraceae bacterium]
MVLTLARSARPNGLNALGFYTGKIGCRVDRLGFSERPVDDSFLVSGNSTTSVEDGLASDNPAQQGPSQSGAPPCGGALLRASEERRRATRHRLVSTIHQFDCLVDWPVIGCTSSSSATAIQPRGGT